MSNLFLPTPPARISMEPAESEEYTEEFEESQEYIESDSSSPGEFLENGLLLPPMLTPEDSEPPEEELTTYEAARNIFCVCGGALVEGDEVWCDGCPKGFHLLCLPSASLARAEKSLETFTCDECEAKRTQAKKETQLPGARKAVLVGSDHQVSVIPRFFLCPDENEFVAARPPPRLVWRASHGLTEEAVDEYLAEAKAQWPKDVFVKASGPLIPRKLRKAVFRTSRFAKHEKAINRLDLYTCPFANDFALNLLHGCDYDIHAALDRIGSKEFKKNFRHLCHPPTQPYANKWSPGDRRWKLHYTPVPGKSGPLATPAELAIPDGPSARERRMKLLNLKREMSN